MAHTKTEAAKLLDEWLKAEMPESFSGDRLSELIKAVRYANGKNEKAVISQSTLAEQLGLSQRWVSMAERGETHKGSKRKWLDLETLEAIASVVDRSVPDVAYSLGMELGKSEVGLYQRVELLEGTVDYLESAVKNMQARLALVEALPASASGPLADALLDTGVDVCSSEGRSRLTNLCTDVEGGDVVKALVLGQMPLTVASMPYWAALGTVMSQATEQTWTMDDIRALAKREEEIAL